MRILFIEPTPSPHSMKVNLDFRLPDGERRTYTTQNSDRAPDYIRRILQIPGVAGVFHTADFIAVDREPKAEWQPILQAVRQSFGDEDGASAPDPAAALPTLEQTDALYGESTVFVQKFREIPLQIRVKSDQQEERIALSQRFIDAAMKAQFGSPNLIKERMLVDYGIRYGERKEIALQVAEELEAAYDDERISRLVEAALGKGTPDNQVGQPAHWSAEEIAHRLADPNWKIRYAALERLKPTTEMLPIVEQALADSHFSIRRLAVVYLGDIREPVVFPLLYRMLRDPVASVRRTAGDCLSDIGDPDAIAPMCEALADPARIVRWRAARYLYEVGDKRALPALHAALDDPEFEIKMQVQYAIARIEGGEEAAGSVWQQMTRRDRT